MTKEKWENKIRNDCKEAKTYKTEFENVIQALADILATKDMIQEQWVNEGCHATIVNTTDRSGKENVHKNPLLVMVNDYNNTALKYWVELGLTPKSLKAINKGLSDDDSETLADVLKSLGGK